MWKKRRFIKKKRWTAQDRSYLQWCRVRWTIGTASGNQHTKKRKKKKKNQKVKNRDSLGWQAPLEKWAYSWTRANRGNLIYKNCDIFVFSVSPFSICGGLQQGTNICISFFFLPVFFLSLGVNHFCLAPLWYCWTKKHVCEHIVIISVAFWMSIAL